jgi:hypothetical protein
LKGERKLMVHGSGLKVNGNCGSRFMVNGSSTSEATKSMTWLMIMTQDERWNIRYQEVVEFIKTNHRNPSKHRIEEHDMLNWLKANRKVMNAGLLKLERVEKFKELLALMEEYKRVNQYM